MPLEFIILNRNYTFKLLLVLSVVLVSCKPPLDKLGPDLCPSPDFSFSADDLKIEGLNALKPLISNFAVRAGEKLRHENQKCSQVSVFISTSRFGKQPQYRGFNSFRFSHPINDTRSILMGANTALDIAFQEGYAYAKAGILLSQFSCPTVIQKSLFETMNQLYALKQDENLMQFMA